MTGVQTCALPISEVIPTLNLQGSETILLVEDDERLRGLACRILKLNGYTVLGASGGPEAELICQHFEGRIHLVLTDVVMPGIGGLELVDRLNLLRPALKVLYTSGYAGSAIVHWDVLHKETSFLPKPFSASHVNQMLNSLSDSGLIYKNRHGRYSLAVPLLNRFILRQMTQSEPLLWQD